MGIEPTSSAWKAEVLPLNYTRFCTLWFANDERTSPPSAIHKDWETQYLTSYATTRLLLAEISSRISLA